MRRAHTQVLGEDGPQLYDVWLRMHQMVVRKNMDSQAEQLAISAAKEASTLVLPSKKARKSCDK